MSNKISLLIGAIIGFVVGFTIPILLCLLFPLNPDKFQGWFAAWIQGSFWIPNWIISWFKDVWYIHAPLCGKGYDFWFWVGVIGSIICFVWGSLNVIAKYRMLLKRYEE